jgi:hypothetical protein
MGQRTGYIRLGVPPVKFQFGVRFTPFFGVGQIVAKAG